MIFGDKMRRHRNISVHGHNIEVVDSFTYLGVFFQRIYHFYKQKSMPSNKVEKLYFAYIEKLETKIYQ